MNKTLKFIGRISNQPFLSIIEGFAAQGGDKGLLALCSSVAFLKKATQKTFIFLCKTV